MNILQKISEKARQGVSALAEENWAERGNSLLNKGREVVSSISDAVTEDSQKMLDLQMRLALAQTEQNRLRSEVHLLRSTLEKNNIAVPELGQDQDLEAPSAPLV